MTTIYLWSTYCTSLMPSMRLIWNIYDSLNISILLKSNTLMWP